MTGSASMLAAALIRSSAPMLACAYVATICSTEVSDQPACSAMSWFGSPSLTFK